MCEVIEVTLEEYYMSLIDRMTSLKEDHHAIMKLIKSELPSAKRLVELSSCDDIETMTIKAFISYAEKCEKAIKKDD